MAGNLNRTVAELNATLLQVDTLMGTDDGSLTYETSMRKAADTILNKAIEKEQTTREAADKSLDQRLSAVQAAYISAVTMNETTGEISITVGSEE